MWCESEDLNKVERHSFWISLNEFMARLTKANICNFTQNAVHLCNTLLDNQKLGENPEMFEIILLELAQKLRRNPILFDVALSAASQHMILAASNIYTTCKKSHTYFGHIYRWDDWKAVFKQAGSVENAKARNDALSAAVAMDTAERLFNSCKELEEKQLTIWQTSDESGQTKDVQARMESKRQKQAEKGAAHKTTSLQGTTSQLKSSNRYDLLSSLPEDD